MTAAEHGFLTRMFLRAYAVQQRLNGATFASWSWQGACLVITIWIGICAFFSLGILAVLLDGGWPIWIFTTQREVGLGIVVSVAVVISGWTNWRFMAYRDRPEAAQVYAEKADFYRFGLFIASGLAMIGGFALAMWFVGPN